MTEKFYKIRTVFSRFLFVFTIVATVLGVSQSTHSDSVTHVWDSLFVAGFLFFGFLAFLMMMYDIRGMPFATLSVLCMGLLILHMQYVPHPGIETGHVSPWMMVIGALDPVVFVFDMLFDFAPPLVRWVLKKGS